MSYKFKPTPDLVEWCAAMDEWARLRKRLELTPDRDMAELKEKLEAAAQRLEEAWGKVNA